MACQQESACVSFHLPNESKRGQGRVPESPSGNSPGVRFPSAAFVSLRPNSLTKGHERGSLAEARPGSGVPATNPRTGSGTT